MIGIQIISNILISSAFIALASSSFALIYYPTKFFHLAHAAIITFGAYFVFLFANKFLIPFPVSVALAIAVATIVGVACEVLVYSQMRKRNVPALAYLIASIGLYVVLQNCISLFFGDDTKIINTAEVTVGNQIFGAYITTVQIITIFVSIALFIAVNLFLHYTATGKSIRAVASNPELCNIYGISSNKIILIAFGIGSALAAIAGILSAMDTNMTPTFGFNLLLYGVVAMIIGGVGSTRGLIAGALLVATAQHLSAYYIDTKWMDAVTYIILILFLIWKPLGFSGKSLKKVEI
ncbi:MAG: ABC transporter permease [Bacteroidetes bacterium RIFCSPLOWO2_02_FULL_36_8]|nr:MAG: ABC transporter permease [Bacteroidetes bacterium RIFCSPLOWO2_02_FULL_36_8]OFY70944.1 MAG: ABC transporter permease [Bacteroidetes bacterium RIFCSPLOWO2_12_FULL_37_12]